jgi:hypothetical protein
MVCRGAVNIIVSAYFNLQICLIKSTPDALRDGGGAGRIAANSDKASQSIDITRDRATLGISR